MDNLEKLLKIYREISYLNSALSLLQWDQRTYLPTDSGKDRSEVIGYLASEFQKKVISEETEVLLANIQPEKLDVHEKRIYTLINRNYNRLKNIPPNLYLEYKKTISAAQNTWVKAKSENDYESFKPYLKRNIELSREIAFANGYFDNPYNYFLDIYDFGMNEEKINKIIGTFKDDLIDLTDKILHSKEINDSFLNNNFSIDGQKNLCKYVLEKFSFNFKQGRFDESIHPFTISISRDDVRITTDFKPGNFTSSLYGTIHECGHALYEMGFDKKFSWTPISQGASYSIHESQSRLLENLIGKSYPFTKFLFPHIKNIFIEMQDIKLIDFYKAINKVKNQPIRIEADEVTYNLHILIRYEIESALLKNKISLANLPELWNEKMKEYLGIYPENSSVGVLQDIHWSGGKFGYFPSYMLGNLISCQMFQKLLAENTDVFESVSMGDFTKLILWLRENVYKYGALYDTDELIKKITGKELSSEYFMNYLKIKYSEIYNIF